MNRSLKTVSNLRVKTIAPNHADLQWTKPSKFVSRFEIRNADDNSVIDTVDNTTTNYRVEGLSPKTKYRFAVVAIYEADDTPHVETETS